MIGKPQNGASENESHFEPLYAELDLTPRKLVSFHAEAEWSYEQNCLLSHLFSGRLHNSRGDRLAVEYRYEKDFRDSINLNAGIALTSRIRVSGIYERNLENDTDIEKGVQFLYQSQCWSAAVSYVDDSDDQRISGMIRLHGLGQIGNGL